MSSHSSKNKGVRKKSVKIGNQILEESLATEPTEATAVVGGTVKKRKSDTGRSGTSIPRSFTGESNSKKKSGKKSVPKQQNEGIIGDDPLPKEKSSAGKGEVEVGSAHSGNKNPSTKSNKSRKTAKSATGSKPKLQEVEVTKHLFGYGVPDDVENQQVWNTQCTKKKTLGIISAILLLILLVVTIFLYARPQGGQGSGSNATATTDPATPPTTTDKCGARPPSNDSTAVGAYCSCSNDNFGACGKCCERLSDILLECIYFC